MRTSTALARADGVVGDGDRELPIGISIMSQKSHQYVLNAVTVVVGIPTLFVAIAIFAPQADYRGPIEWTIALILGVLLSTVAVWVVMVLLVCLEFLFYCCFPSRASHSQPRTEGGATGNDNSISS